MPPEAGQPEQSLNLWIVELIRSAEACAQGRSDCAERLADDAGRAPPH